MITDHHPRLCIWNNQTPGGLNQSRDLQKRFTETEFMHFSLLNSLFLEKIHCVIGFPLSPDFKPSGKRIFFKSIVFLGIFLGPAKKKLKEELFHHFFCARKISLGPDFTKMSYFTNFLTFMGSKTYFMKIYSPVLKKHVSYAN